MFDWYRNYKATQKCARCPEWRPECLQFHHVDSKLKAFDVSQAVRRGISIERLKEEIGKCVILCANCHAVEEPRGVELLTTYKGSCSTIELIGMKAYTIGGKDPSSYICGVKQEWQQSLVSV